jgi:regulator of sirC expression with transglutaminase-like and TPR domain
VTEVAYTFEELAIQADEKMDLARAALLIARDEYPQLDVEEYVQRLDLMAAAVAERMPANASPPMQIQVLNNFLFVERRFHGNTENYYDPRNSYLNEVLDRRTGIPIALCVIYTEIARRLKVPLRGVNMPGHFIVRYDAPGVDLYVDPFNGGRVLTEEDCHEVILNMAGGAVQSSAAYLLPASHRVILTRVLTNLKVIYMHCNDYTRTLRTLNRILQLNPAATTEFKERGLVYAAGQQYHAALCDLITYLTNAPHAPDSDAIQEHIDRILTEVQRRN